MQTGLELSESFTPRDATPKLAKVLKVYPEANMVDLLFFDGSFFRRVPVAVPYASNKTGGLCLSIPKYDVPVKEKIQDILIATSKETENDVLALAIFVEAMTLLPIVVGFIFPEESEVLCSTEQEGNEKGTMHLWKHQSNVYTRIADDGDIEISHPSGVFIKVGKNTERTPILNYDRLIRPFKWKNPDTDELNPAPYVFIQHPSGTYFFIDPEGNITEHCVGNVYIKIDGNLVEEIKGNKQLTVNGDMTTQVDGDITRETSSNMLDKAERIDHNE